MTAPLVYLPGWGLGRRPWEASQKAHPGAILDLPGYGSTPLVARFTDATDALAESIPAAATLCGWSLGAMLALAIAARHPERVGRLVLVAGTASFVQREAWESALPPAMLTEFRAGVLADFAGMLPRFVGGFNRGDSKAKALTATLLELAGSPPPPETLAQGLDWLRDTDLRPLLPSIHQPTLIIHGQNDPLMPIAAAEALAMGIPGARLAVMPDAAHAPFLSDPALFAQLLAQHLQG